MPAFDYISFTTDYGLSDGFVASCHGVIARLAPPVRVIDVTHQIAPGEVTRAAGRATEGDTMTATARLDGPTTEFVLATVTENHKHADVMKKNPDMEHDDPNAKRLQPHGNGEIVWKFTKRGEFEFACLIPGHYEKGMVGKIIVK